MLTVSSDKLQGVVTNSLERMAFVFCESTELTGGEMLALANAHASIELRGDSNYVVTVSASSGFIQEVASGMMGCEPDEIDVDDHGRATVAELANIFGGELAMHLATEKEGMLIGLPRELDDEGIGRYLDAVGRGGLCSVHATELGQLMVCVVSD
ncbi:MAG: CheY-specific phosphatase CheX [Planctomycetota bacterium]|jgi:CheY-specific phosphatase CheX